MLDSGAMAEASSRCASHIERFTKSHRSRSSLTAPQADRRHLKDRVDPQISHRFQRRGVLNRYGNAAEVVSMASDRLQDGLDPHRRKLGVTGLRVAYCRGAGVIPTLI